jgi:DNA-directed RNA polymerase specialized sigma24 family protein
MALTLHLQEELPVREIAFVLDLTDNSVRMKIYRGLQKVRALVREEP